MLVTRVTRQVLLVEQELLALPEHMRSPWIFSGVLVAQSLVFCLVFWGSLFILLSFFRPLFFSALLRITASDYNFGIYGVRVMVFNATFNNSYVAAVSFIGGGNSSGQFHWWRKQ